MACASKLLEEPKSPIDSIEATVLAITLRRGNESIFSTICNLSN
jgi:hypothetical protein